jgi:hypothetical protein
LWTESAPIALQQSDEDVRTLSQWVETKVKPKNIKHHVNSFLRTDGDKLRMDNGVLVLLRRDGDKEERRAFLPIGVAERVLKVLHDDKGHFGFAKTKEAVKSRYFWFNWQKDVKHWCNSCETCLRRKCPTVPDRQPTGQLPAPRRPFQWWHMDFAGPLPKTTRGNKYIFALTDPFTKWPEAFAVPDQSAQTTAEVVYREIVCRYGLPDGLHADQGKNFEANLMHELCKRLDIQRTRSSPANPQGNGQAERTNRTLAERLAMEIEASDQTDWDLKLPAALSAMRTVVNKTTKETPFYVAFGFEARNPGDVIRSETPIGTNSNNKEGIHEMAARLDDLKNLHLKVRSRILREQADRNRRESRHVKFTPFQEGEKVWKKVQGQKKGLAKKLVGQRWKGPFTVKARKGETTYRVQLEGKGQRKQIINHRRLKKHFARPSHLESSTDSEYASDSDEVGPLTQRGSDSRTVDNSWQLNDDEEAETTPRNVNGRPQRARRPPLRLTYEAGGQQLERRSFSESSSE